MKTKEELYSENFDVLSVNGKEVLFTCLRISRDIIPEGLPPTIFVSRIPEVSSQPSSLA